MSMLNLTPERAFGVRRGGVNGRAEEGRVVLGGQYPASIESLQKSVVALTTSINSTRATFSVLSEQGESIARRMPASDERKQLQNHFVKIRQDYRAVAAITESIAEISKLIIDRLDEIADAKQLETDLPMRFDAPPAKKL